MSFLFLFALSYLQFEFLFTSKLLKMSDLAPKNFELILELGDESKFHFGKFFGEVIRVLAYHVVDIFE